MGEPVREKDRRLWPHLKGTTERVAPARVVVLAPAATAKDVAVRAPGAVEAETVWPQLEERMVAVADEAPLLTEEIQCGAGFSLDEFRRGCSACRS